MEELLTRPQAVGLFLNAKDYKPAPIYVVVTASGPMVLSSGLLNTDLNGPQFLSVAFNLGRKAQASPRPEGTSHATAR